MDKTRLFEFLSTQNASVLLSLLNAAYDEMDYDQRQAVFWRMIFRSTFAAGYR